MYKRIAKRIERHAREEELGITQEDKEVLGLQDTDTEESDSDDGSDSGKDLEEDADEEGQDAAEAEDDEDGAESLSGIIPQVTLTEALAAPIYKFLGETKAESCVVCPGKMLETKAASQLHANSGSHKRRFKRFETFVAKARKNGSDLDEQDAASIVQAMDAARPPLPPPKEKPKPKRKREEPKGPNRKQRRAALRKAAEEAAKANGQEAPVSKSEVMNVPGVAPPPLAETVKPKKTKKNKAQPDAATGEEMPTDGKETKKRKHHSEPIVDQPKRRKTKSIAT